MIFEFGHKLKIGRNLNFQFRKHFIEFTFYSEFGPVTFLYYEINVIWNRGHLKATHYGILEEDEGATSMLISRWPL